LFGIVTCKAVLLRSTDSMKVTFFGAAHQVTGSCHLIETKTKRILFDCGMFQGGNYNEGRNADAFPFDPSELDAVFVSHAHADHSGRVPKLIRDGYAGAVYMTKGTRELAKIIWDDSLSIMRYDNEKFQRPILFDEHDIDEAYGCCDGVDYHQKIDLGDGVTALFKDAGHIFGSSFIELHADGKTLAYSGDLGNKNAPIVRPTEMLGEIDVLLIESTYGDRLHEPEGHRKQLLLDIVKKGIANGGVIMMPAFSIERTQEILYDLDQLKEHDKTLPNLPIYLDSPMAIKAGKVYKEFPEYYDEEAAQQYKMGDDFLHFDGLEVTPSREDSKRINHSPNPKMIIAGAGMMNGGRILHHAKRYLPDPASLLVLVGYQAQGTLGRRLYEGAEEVEIHGDRIPVRATVTAIGALSAHADQDKLVDWVRSAKKTPAKVYCVHGEPHASTELAHRLKKEISGLEAFVPEEGETVEI